MQPLTKTDAKIYLYETQKKLREIAQAALTIANDRMADQAMACVRQLGYLVEEIEKSKLN